jgi:hypothetical protein
MRQPSRRARASTRAPGKQGALWRVASRPWRPCFPVYARCAQPGDPKTLGVVQSHYRVDVAALATGDGTEAEANCLDALAAPAADILADDFEEVLFPKAPHAGPLEP